MTRRIATLSASLIALCAATAAHAQDDATEEKQNATGFGEIVVTATRQATELQDTPLAVTAQTSEQLESKGITSTADIGNIVPNATFRTAQGAFGKAVTAFIRGIGQGDSNLAAEPGVAYYIDDVYYPLLFGSQFDLLDLDHVEVLRGPQGTLFGRNALAGAVNIVSKEPDFNNPSATITVTMGRYQRLDIRAGFNLPLADNFAIRVNGSTKHRVGYQDKLDFRCEMIRRGTPQLAGNFPYADGILIQAQNFNPDNCVVGHLGGDNINAVRGTALWEPVPELHISVTGDYTDDKSENQADTLVNVNNTVGASRANINAIGDYYSVAGQPPVRYDSRFVTGDPYTTFATYGDPIGTGQALPGSSFHNGNVLRGGLRYPTISPVLNYGVSAKIVYDVAQNMAITLVGGYRYVDTLFGFDVDGSPFALEQTRNNTGEDHWTGELRFTGTTDFLDWAVGLFYYRGHGYVHTTLVSPWNNQQRYQNHQYEPDSKAVYGNFVVKPFDGFRVTLGGRYSDDSKFVNYDNRQDATPSGDVIFQVTPGDKRVDWKAGADYKLAEDTMVYVSAATGFRLPGFNARPFQPSQITQIPGDDILAYELGIKTDLFDKRLRINATGFYTDYKTRPSAVGGQEYLAGPNGQPIPVPGGGSITIPLPAGGDGATTCRVLTPAEITAGTVGYQCVSRNYYINTPGKVKGVELEISAQPIDNLLIDGSLGYSKFTAADILAPTRVNQRVTGIPEWTANAGVQYEIDAPGLNGTITPRLDWFYQGSMVYSAASTMYNQPGYSVFNARISYHFEPYDATIAIGATNVFNKFYWQNFFILQDFGFPQADAQPSRPREWFVSIGKKF